MVEDELKDLRRRAEYLVKEAPLPETQRALMIRDIVKDKTLEELALINKHITSMVQDIVKDKTCSYLVKLLIHWDENSLREFVEKWEARLSDIYGGTEEYLIKHLERVRKSSKSRQIEQTAGDDGTWIKLHILRGREIKEALASRIPPVDRSKIPKSNFFWSDKHNDWAVRPEFEGEVKEALADLYPGKLLAINRDANIWHVTSDREEAEQAGYFEKLQPKKSEMGKKQRRPPNQRKIRRQ